jgi:hypothetical protein
MNMINTPDDSRDWKPLTQTGPSDPGGVAKERTADTDRNDDARRGGGPLLAWWNTYFGEDNRA